MKTKHKRWDSFKLFCSIFAETMFEGDTMNELKKDRSMLVRFLLFFGGSAIIAIYDFVQGSTIIGTVIDVAVWFGICFFAIVVYDQIRGNNKEKKTR